MGDEIDSRHPDGALRHLSISATPLRDDTGFEGSLALVSDITATRSATRNAAIRVLCDWCPSGCLR